nr:MAG TPA: hypothetical protein [Caudoviricetes sp.]
MYQLSSTLVLYYHFLVLSTLKWSFYWRTYRSNHRLFE